MQPLEQRQVTLVVTLIANSDDRAREIIEAMTKEDGSVLGFEIVAITDARVQDPPQ
jgi:hypothetical protein